VTGAARTVSSPLFLLPLAATLAFRLWLSSVVPVTADEAYFALWGRNPAFGYYDHPPLIGWILAPLVAASGALWVLRLPALLAPAAAALLVRALLVRGFGLDAERASLAALCVLLLPMNVWNVLVTTDAPFLVFATASVLVFALAAARARPALFFAAGLLLGLAFLAKYFALLLALAYLLWAIRGREWRALGLVLAGALPALFVNVAWNAGACWSNVLFNAVHRHAADAGPSLRTPVLYVAALVYLAGPLLWLAWRERARLAATWAEPAARALFLAWLVPFAVFAALSPVRRIGLHWLLGFLPALAAWAARMLDRAALVRAVRFFAALAAVHAGALLLLVALPLETWRQTPIHARLLFLVYVPEIAARAAPPGFILAADSYSVAALAAWHTRREVPVFGVGSAYARQDDILTDWRRYDGRDLAVLRREPPRLQDYEPFFRAVEVRALEAGGARAYTVLGRGFDYASYRHEVLEEIRRRYYRIPAWLPVHGCDFLERYFTP